MNDIKVEKYLEYKDSGEEWLGEIPKHWDLIKVKNVFRLVIEPAPKNNDFELLSVYTDIGVKPRRELEARGNKASTTDGYWKVKKGDIIVNKLLAWMGAIGVSNYDGVTSPAYDILRAKVKIEYNFFHYLFRNEACISELRRHSRGIMNMRLRLYFDKFGNILVPFPKYQEQKKIVDYLDRKTALINQAIDIKQKQIELLKERRQILIHQAVTRGLNPDVKMKDSGVEWIGEVPEHWEVKRLKFLITKSYSGGTPSTENLSYWDGGIPWVSSVDVKKTFLKTTKRNISERGLTNSSSKLAREGTIIIVTRSGILQHTLPISILLVDMAINQDIKCFEFNSKLKPIFLVQFVKGKNNEVLVETRQQAATVESINLSQFINLLIPVPPVLEQEAIINHIQNQSIKISNAISLKEQEIEKLKEYKSTLINSAVTGKIKVC